MLKYYKSPQNEVYAYEADGSQDHMIEPNFILIEESEIESVVKAKEQEIFNTLNYAEKRSIKYGTIGEQLDLIYHQGIDAWKAEIKKIKDSYPKP